MRFRRPIRRPRLARRLLRNELPHEEQLDLRQAHHLMDVGEYQPAGASFWHLAENAENSGLQGRSPFLYIQAGRAFTLSGNSKMAENSFVRGFELLARSNRWRALNDVSNQVLLELKHSGNTLLAEVIETWIRSNVTENLTSSPSKPINPNPSRPSLPAKCPYCGASVSPVDVDWFDETTAACNYCGSVISE
jgi:hypothetical protein